MPIEIEDEDYKVVDDVNECIARNEKKRKRENDDFDDETKRGKAKEFKNVYIGETNRTNYERGREHWDDLLRLDAGSHLQNTWLNTIQLYNHVN